VIADTAHGQIAGSMTTAAAATPCSATDAQIVAEGRQVGFKGVGAFISNS